MPNVLTINGGSSSIRFAVFEASRPLRRLLQGKMERIGSDDASMTVDRGAGEAPVHMNVPIKERGNPIDFLMDWLESQPLFKTLDGVGHRVVHGMRHTHPERVTAELLNELKGIIP